MEKPVTILLVEDELIIADYMRDCLERLGYEVCAICLSYDEAVAALQKHLPDLAIVDITLKGNRNGIDLGHYIRDRFQMPFIFATSHSDRGTIDQAKQAYPFAYLIKPFSEEDLYAVIETALMQFGRRKQPEACDDDPVIIQDSIFIRHKSKFVKLPLSDLLYIEANDNYATLVTTAGKYALKTTLKNLGDALPDVFWRTHRSYIVNLTHLLGFDSDEVNIKGTTLPLGKSFYPLLMERLKIVQG